jgi:hypothetical protein
LGQLGAEPGKLLGLGDVAPEEDKVVDPLPVDQLPGGVIDGQPRQADHQQAAGFKFRGGDRHGQLMG